MNLELSPFSLRIVRRACQDRLARLLTDDTAGGTLDPNVRQETIDTLGTTIVLLDALIEAAQTAP